MPLFKVVLDRFENSKAVLIFEDGTQLVIDRDKLGVEFKEGEVLHLALVKDKNLSGQQYKLMQKKLADILNNKNEIT